MEYMIVCCQQSTSCYFSDWTWWLAALSPFISCHHLHCPFYLESFKLLSTDVVLKLLLSNSCSPDVLKCAYLDQENPPQNSGDAAFQSRKLDLSTAQILATDLWIYFQFIQVQLCQPANIHFDIQDDWRQCIIVYTINIHFHQFTVFICISLLTRFCSWW